MPLPCGIDIDAEDRMGDLRILRSGGSLFFVRLREGHCPSPTKNVNDMEETL